MVITASIPLPVFLLQAKGLIKDVEDGRKQASHKFRTGSPPNYEYVYIDNYSHN